MVQPSKKICITVGTRPEAIKLAPVILQFQKSDKFQTQVVLTGQHREMVDQVMNIFGIKADYDLNIMQPGQTLSDITCRSLQGLEKLWQKLQPQMVLAQGDTTTAFSAALAAFYQRIPIGHVEAGLRTNDLFNPYPEEANRRLISQIAQLHFAPTSLAVENLQKSGIVDGIHQTGNTVIDALLKVAERKRELNITGLDWEKYRVILATVHRRENWGQPISDIAHGFLDILEQFQDTALLLPLHRNPTVREPLQKILGEHERVFLTEPLNYQELVDAMQCCYMVMTDSGGLQEEAPSLGKPVLVLRQTTERQEAVTAGTAKLIGTEPQNIISAASLLLENTSAYQKMANVINPFGDGQASERIVDIVDNFLV